MSDTPSHKPSDKNPFAFSDRYPEKPAAKPGFLRRLVRTRRRKIWLAAALLLLCMAVVLAVLYVSRVQIIKVDPSSQSADSNSNATTKTALGAVVNVVPEADIKRSAANQNAGGIINALDLAGKTLVVQTTSGQAVSLKLTDKSQLYADADGSPLGTDKLKVGGHLNATYDPKDMILKQGYYR